MFAIHIKCQACGGPMLDDSRLTLRYARCKNSECGNGQRY